MFVKKDTWRQCELTFSDFFPVTYRILRICTKEKLTLKRTFTNLDAQIVRMNGSKR